MTDKKKRAAVLKERRAENPEGVARAQALMKEQKKMEKLILDTIRDEAKTVPQIAAEINVPAHEVLWYVTVYKKYEMVIEDGMDMDYFTYKVAEGK